MLFDSHTHLNFEEFADRWQAEVDDCLANDIGVINVGAQLATSKQAVAIAQQYPGGVYASVGLHPIHVEGSGFRPELFDRKVYDDLIKSSKKVVAVGETGIDFFHSEMNLEKQRQVFIEQINLARDNNIAVIVHGRNSRDGRLNAYEEIYKILQAEQYNRAVVHCFGGTVDEAQAFIDLGLYIGFTGIITFKNAGEILEVVRRIPLERILVETDAPYLAPEPYRGQKNKPQYVQYVAQKVAEVRGISYNEVVARTSANTTSLFGLA